ncbi:MAG: polymer-forming cytoskeletal protein [Polaromonas sp.]|nr:polymer-forming cytoskeletal protein [Polaromonas sp.]
MCVPVGPRQCNAGVVVRCKKLISLPLLHSGHVLKVVQTYHPFFFKELQMATPFFGKRETDAPTTPGSLRQGPSNGYNVNSPSGSLNASQTSGLQAHARPTPVETASSATSASSASSGSSNSTGEGGSKLTVGPNIKLKGVEITDCDTLVVEGLVEATMDSRVIQISEQGAFKGSAEIDVAEIRGEFNGNLTVRQKLVIYSTGKVTGTIRYGKLVIEEGGQLAGEILFGAAVAKAPTLAKVG